MPFHFRDFVEHKERALDGESTISPLAAGQGAVEGDGVVRVGEPDAEEGEGGPVRAGAADFHEGQGVAGEVLGGVPGGGADFIQEDADAVVVGAEEMSGIGAAGEGGGDRAPIHQGTGAAGFHAGHAVLLGIGELDQREVGTGGGRPGQTGAPQGEDAGFRSSQGLHQAEAAGQPLLPRDSGVGRGEVGSFRRQCRGGNQKTREGGSGRRGDGNHRTGQDLCRNAGPIYP